MYYDQTREILTEIPGCIFKIQRNNTWHGAQPILGYSNINYN